MEELFKCPLTYELMEDPVLTPYGHSFERSAITQWLLKSDKCPLTRRPLSIKDLHPNIQLRKVIEEYRKQNNKICSDHGTVASESGLFQQFQVNRNQLYALDDQRTELEEGIDVLEVRIDKISNAIKRLSTKIQEKIKKQKILLEKSSMNNITAVERDELDEITFLLNEMEEEQVMLEEEQSRYIVSVSEKENDLRTINYSLSLFQKTVESQKKALLRIINASPDSLNDPSLYIEPVDYTRDEKLKKALKTKERGNRKFRKGKFEDAEALYTKSIEEAHPYILPALYLNRAVVRERLKKYLDAIEDCNIAVQEVPTVKAYRIIGDSYYNLCDHNSAITEGFAKAVDLAVSQGGTDDHSSKMIEYIEEMMHRQEKERKIQEEQDQIREQEQRRRVPFENEVNRSQSDLQNAGQGLENLFGNLFAGQGRRSRTHSRRSGFM
ncbi:hypothetical protein PCE1_002692 [Barthelona sp. PCE]